MAQEANDVAPTVFAESLELSVMAIYVEAVQSGVLRPAISDVVNLFARHHQEHADAFGAASDGKQTGQAHPGVLLALRRRLERVVVDGEAGVLTLLVDIENSLAASYMFTLGSLVEPAAMMVTASILPVAGQHATVLAGALGRPVGALFTGAFETDAERFDPADFPVPTETTVKPPTLSSTSTTMSSSTTSIATGSQP